jgi:hypothetical protein
MLSYLKMSTNDNHHSVLCPISRSQQHVITILEELQGSSENRSSTTEEQRDGDNDTIFHFKPHTAVL